MRHTTTWIGAVMLILAAAGADARMPGQRINPNVMFILDTGRAMNWTPVPPPPAEQNPTGEMRTRNAILACEAMNAVSPQVQKTQWQILVETMLGGMRAEYLHCMYEDPGVRPAIAKDTLKNLNADPTVPYSTTEFEKISQITEEYWKTNAEPHFRLVHCFDPRQPGNRGDWNTYYQQCVGETPVMPGREITTPTGRKYWCRDEDYVLLPSGRELCFNLNPLALERESDGILRRYETLARFAVATFDNIPSPTQQDNGPWDPNNVLAVLSAIHRAGWDFGPDRNWYSTRLQDPTSLRSRFWNAGIRADYPQALGHLVRLTDDLEGANQAVSEVINTVEPLHCSFDGAMIDDVGEYVYHSPETRPAYNMGADMYFNCRPKYVIFITDGIQTDAVEFPQEYCDTTGTAPKPPWDDTPVTTPYSCPFNSTRQETWELFHTVEKLSAGFANPAEVEPLYFIVIGLGVKGRRSPNPCDGDPTWNAAKGECIPPSSECIAMQWVNKPDGTNCVANDYSIPDYQGLRFATPRQYLNLLALTGWPDANFSPYVSGVNGTYRQPPWRETDASGNPIWDWCTTDPDHCGGEDGDGMPNGAIFVESAQELSAVLDNLLNGVLLDEIGTRTEIATTDVVRPDLGGTYYAATDVAQQYAFNSGYHATGGKPWAGYLFRQGYRCSQQDAAKSGGAIAGDNVDFAAKLRDEQGADNRKLYALPDFSDLPNWNDTNRKEGMDVLKELTASDFDDCTFGAPQPWCKSSTSYKDLVLDHLYGRIGERQERPLGDIYNSSPAILPPARERIPIPSYEEFKAMKYIDETGNATRANYQRQPYLYVGTNDGILHAFNVWANNQRIEGWGFVPSVLLGNIDEQFPVAWQENFDPNGNIIGYSVPPANAQTGSYQHIFGVDATPWTGDVLVWRKNSQDEKDYWRSLVIGGLGRGGYGYYALDVTSRPETRPRYRWEISPDFPGLANVGHTEAGGRDAADAVREMGLALTRPAVSYVYFKYPRPDGGIAVEHEQALAILPGGYLNTENKGIETSTGVYLVQTIDGKLVRYLRPDVDDDLCDPNDKMFASNLFTGFASDTKAHLAKVAQLIGEPVVPNGLRTGKVNDEAFIGDDRGRIWRIDMSSRDPAEWCLEVFFDTLIAEHFPYKDCLDASGNTPGSTQCCPSKNGNVGATCLQSEIETFMTDGEIAVDACSGKACTNPDFPFPRIPMLAPPTIVQDKDRNNVILLASGQIDGVTTLDHHRVFSLTVEPTITVTSTKATYQRSEPTINWWLGEPVSDFPVGKHVDTTAGLGRIEAQMFPATGTDTHVFDAPTATFNYFGVGEKLMGRPTVFDQVAYFVTFTPLDKSGSVLDACDAGGSKIWGVHFNDPTDFPQLEDENGSGTKVPYYERPDQLLTGLRLVRRPACSGVEQIDIMVQKAQPDASTGTPAGATDTPTPITSESIRIPKPARGFTRVTIDSWSIVLGGE